MIQRIAGIGHRLDGQRMPGGVLNRIAQTQRPKQIIPVSDESQGVFTRRNFTNPLLARMGLKDEVD
jgi:hypothetical protein